MGAVAYFSLVPLAQDMGVDGFSDNPALFIYYLLVVLLSVLLGFGFITSTASLVKQYSRRHLAQVEDIPLSAGAADGKLEDIAGSTTEVGEQGQLQDVLSDSEEYSLYGAGVDFVNRIRQNIGSLSIDAVIFEADGVMPESARGILDAISADRPIEEIVMISGGFNNALADLMEISGATTPYKD